MARKAMTRSMTKTEYHEMLIKFPLPLHQAVASLAAERGECFSTTVRELLRQHVQEQVNRQVTGAQSA